jgi:hypothetical protein
MVLQSHDKREEGVLERAPVISLQDRHLGEIKRCADGRGTINEGRGWQQWGGTTTMTTMHSNYINIQSRLSMPINLSNINLIFMDVMR